jgi:hypothetical protein
MVTSNFNDNDKVIQVFNIRNIYYNQTSADKLPDKRESKKKFNWSKIISGLHSVFKWIGKILLFYATIDSG